jgi:hypothetical protein
MNREDIFSSSVFAICRMRNDAISPEFHPG